MNMEGDRNMKYSLYLVLVVLYFHICFINSCSVYENDEYEHCEEGGGMIEETTDSKLPIFTWEVKNLSKYPFYMKIDFQDSKYPDIAILMPIMVNGSADISILRGSLKNERPIVEIAVNGRPNSTTFDVTMHSERHEGGLYEIKNGKTIEITFDKCHKDMSHDTRTSPSSPSSSRTAPQRFIVRLSLHYDDQFLKHVAKGNHSVAKHKIREILCLAGPIFQAKPWKLNHSIELVETEISWEKGETLTLNSYDAVDKIQRMEKRNEKKKDAENYHYFTWDHKGGVTGIAGVGTICSSSKAKRTAITEWVQNKDEHYSEEQCLLTFAHELGHSLNMPHDFDPNPESCRVDKKGNNCCQNGSVMDYHQSHVNKWSSCSREKMNEYDFSCVEESGGGLDGDGMSGCKDMTWAKMYCDKANITIDCNGDEKAFYEEYCPKTCNKC